MACGSFSVGAPLDDGAAFIPPVGAEAPLSTCRGGRYREFDSPPAQLYRIVGRSMDYEEPTAIGKSRDAVFRSAEKYALEVGFLPGDRIEPLISRLGGSIVYLGVLDRPDGLNELHGPKALERPNGNAAHDGSLFVDGPRDFRILVSAFTGPERDRFTIAHELGHYVLHSGCGQRRIRASRFGSDPVEWEANWFAAAFLMPKGDFKATARRFKGDSALIAARYLVSQKAAEVRMRSLGLSS